MVPELPEVISVHVIPIMPDGKVVAVNVRSRGVDMPGGHVEATDVSPLAALTREVSEEARIDLAAPILIDVLEITGSMTVTRPQKYMLIYAARVVAVREFVEGNEISERLFISPADFSGRYFGSKEYADVIVRRAVETVGI